MIHKKWLRICMACLLLCALVSCRPAKPELGLFLYNEADPYILEFGRQIIEVAGASFMVHKFDAANSQPIQNEQIESWLRADTGVVIVNPVDRLGAYAVINRLRQLDVPVIFFNREPLPADMALWDEVWYVGAQAAQSGRMQAELVMNLFGNNPEQLNEYDRNGDGRIQTVLLKGEQGHQDAEIRTAEGLKAFEEKGFVIDVLALEVANWNQAQAYDTIGRVLRDHQDAMELVISNNDAMALGAINRLRQAGFFKDNNGNGQVDRADSSWLPVVGIDGLREAEEAIADGFLYGTVKNDSYSMAIAIAELAELIMGTRDSLSVAHTLMDGRYIWIDYLPFVSQQ
ncbi:MAG: galactose ABC transporter substrate-binding protein [Spirochaetes bacterium]|nr:galactose ABC transporter substrate-binding protein [Spirochaetota bacterium]MBU0956245.1 galactose ABC transporter substrate-binding protein [Spirochaetota bacterium]